MAVGVDYALFYVIRSREERRRGLPSHEALERTARTSGRTVLVSGTTVAIAMAGMFVIGSDIFNGIASGTIAVVACAVAGSVTVLPAVLELLGPRIDRGRIPFLPHLQHRRRSLALLARRHRPRAAPASAVLRPLGRTARRARRPGTRAARREAERRDACRRRTSPRWRRSSASAPSSRARRRPRIVVVSGRRSGAGRGDAASGPLRGARARAGDRPPARSRSAAAPTGRRQRSSSR